MLDINIPIDGDAYNLNYETYRLLRKYRFPNIIFASELSIEELSKLNGKVVVIDVYVKIKLTETNLCLVCTDLGAKAYMHGVYLNYYAYIETINSMYRLSCGSEGDTYGRIT